MAKGKKININKASDRYEEDCKKRDKEYKKYKKAANDAMTAYQEEQNNYNGLIGVINSTCNSLQTDMASLYEFLKKLGGNSLEEVTPFDFVIEKVAPDMNYQYIDCIKDPVLEIEYPLTDPVPVTFRKNRKNKDKLDEFEKKIEMNKIECDKDLQDRANMNKNIKLASEIAREYLATLSSVSRIVKEKILPNIDLITAFMYADSINKRLPNLDETDVIEPLKVSSYEGGRYNEYFMFVQNTIDFLSVCESFFTKTPLTDIMSDHEVTDKELKDFEDAMEAVKNAGDNLKGMGQD